MKKILIVTFVMLCSTGWSQDAEKIMRQSYDLKEPETLSSFMIMHLRDSKGRKTERRFRLQSRQTDAGTDSLIEFLSPADVKGTRFLSLSQKEEETEQRIWLPDLGRVRRITGAGKYKSFMGSDLTYFDMETREFDDAAYVLKGRETVECSSDGVKKTRECWIIESVPGSESPYASTLIWIGQEDHFLYRSEIYGKEGEKIKTVHILEVLHRNGVILPVKTLVVNENGHRTLLIMEEVDVNPSLADDVFTVRSLEQ